MLSDSDVALEEENSESEVEMESEKENEEGSESSDDEYSWQPPCLYHYTSEDRIMDIVKSGKIRKSVKGCWDAFDGDGVYLTGMSPDNKIGNILENNWGRGNGHLPGTRHHPQYHRTEYCVEVPITNLPNVEQQPGNRDVWRYNGNIALKENMRIFRVRRVKIVGKRNTKENRNYKEFKTKLLRQLRKRNLEDIYQFTVVRQD